MQVQVLTRNVTTGVLEYEDIPGSVFNVSASITDLTLYESYLDLSISGFGVSSLSYIFLMPTIVPAGDTFEVRIYPRNA